MEMLFSWFIKSFIVSGILYLYYVVTLRDKQFHLYNRAYLLTTVILSLMTPFLNIKWIEIKVSQNNAFNLFLNSPSTPFPGVHIAGSLTPDQIIVGCAIAVSLVLVLMLFSRIVWVFRIKFSGDNTRLQGVNFIETDAKQAPFSFLKNLFWKKGMLINDTNGEKILNHELAHIRQGHTYDKLFCQLASCICWINPFYWLIQKELNIIHEFLADEESIEPGDAESFAIMLLHSYNKGRYLNPSHLFFSSSIKRRLVMITSSKHIRYSYARRVLVLPLILLLLTVLSIGVKAKTGLKLNRDSLLFTNVSIQNKATGQNMEDSTAKGRDNYINKNTAPPMLDLNNVQYETDDRNRNEKKTIDKKEGNQHNLLQQQHAEKLAAEKAALNK